MNLRNLAVFTVLIAFLPGSPCATQQHTNPPLPPVLSYAQPIYPQIARSAHVEGDVVASIVTDGELVGMVTIESGPPLLTKVTDDNLRTWKFAPHQAGTFRVTFRYKIVDSAPEVVSCRHQTSWKSSQEL